jgi:nucleoside-diphosphate-sugar epimerase
MSTGGVYASPPDGRSVLAEDAPLGGSPQPYAPTYCVSKICNEAVAKYACQEFDLPTTITRMNVAYGDNGGLPAMQLDMLLAGQPIPILPGRASLCSPIHEDDIASHTAPLLAAASVPANVVNWGGDEHVETSEYVGYMAGLSGREVEIVESDQGIHQCAIDPTKRRKLAGDCKVDWKDGLRRMIRARHPEIELQA